MKTDNRKPQKQQKLDRAIQLNYDRLSKWYDLLAGQHERKARAAGLDFLKVKEGDVVLEIGFGTGQALVDLAQSAGAAGKVWGIDISGGMVFQAKRKITSATLSDRVALQLGDASHLPFHACFCNAIFMSFVLELFESEEIIYVLCECQRVLKRGGVMSVVALAKKENPGLPARIYEWAHKEFPKFIDCRPIDVQRLVLHAGFCIQEVTEMKLWGLPVMIVLAEKR